MPPAGILGVVVLGTPLEKSGIFLGSVLAVIQAPATAGIAEALDMERDAHVLVVGVLRDAAAGRDYTLNEIADAQVLGLERLERRVVVAVNFRGRGARCCRRNRRSRTPRLSSGGTGRIRGRIRDARY